jgi:hypothetical protein
VIENRYKSFEDVKLRIFDLKLPLFTAIFLKSFDFPKSMDITSTLSDYLLARDISTYRNNYVNMTHKIDPAIPSPLDHIDQVIHNSVLYTKRYVPVSGAVLSGVLFYNNLESLGTIVLGASAIGAFNESNRVRTFSQVFETLSSRINKESPQQQRIFGRI